MIILWFLRVRVFTFHTSIPCDKTFLLVTSSKSSARSKSVFKVNFIQKNKTYIGHNFQMVLLMTFIFDIWIHCEKTFLFLTSSRSSVKVTVSFHGHLCLSAKTFTLAIGVEWQVIGLSYFTYIYIISNLFHQLVVNMGKYLPQKGKVCKNNLCCMALVIFVDLSLFLANTGISPLLTTS